MKMKEIKELNNSEIEQKLEELNKELFNLKIQAKTGQLENSARIKQARRDIARLKTETTARAAAS